MRLLIGFGLVCLLLAGLVTWSVGSLLSDLRSKPRARDRASEPAASASRPVNPVIGSEPVVHAPDESQAASQPIATETMTAPDGRVDGAESADTQPAAPVRWAATDTDLQRLRDRLAAAQAAQREDPTSEGARREELQCLIGLRRFADAKRVLDDLLAANPDDADLWFESGGLRLARREWIEAADAFQHVLSLRPGDRKSRYNLATAYTALRRLGDAERLWSQLLADTPDDADVHARRGEVRLDLRDFAGAADDFARAAERWPQDAAVAMNLAQARERLVDGRGAVEGLRLFLARAPRNVPVMNRLATLLTALWREDESHNAADRDEALRLYRESLSIVPDQPEVAAAIAELSR